MGAGDKTITLTLQTIADVKQAEGQLKQLKQIIDQMKPDANLADGFREAFSKAENYAKKANEVIDRGFKNKRDITSFASAMDGLVKEYKSILSASQKLDKENLSNFLSQEQINKFNELTEALKRSQDALKNYKYGGTNLEDKLTQLGDQYKYVKDHCESYQKAMERLNFTNAQKAINNLVEDQEKAKNKLDELKAAQAKAVDQPEKYKQISEQIEAQEDRYNKLGQAITNYRIELENTRREYDNYKKSVIDSQKALDSFDKNTMTDLEKKQQEYINSLEQTIKALQGYKDAQVKAGEETVRFGNELDQFKNRIAYFFGLNNAVRLFQRAVRSAYATVKDLDKVMTETAVVTDFSVADMWKQLPEYTERANKLGVTIHDVYESATLYYQQGLKTNEVMAVSNATLKMARIAGLEAAEATDRMTNALRGFNMEITETNADRVADVYSKLAAISASDVDEISTAMTKTASLASNANMQFETTAAFLAQIIETTRESAETAGTALKTVIARFSEVKELFSKGELLGIDEEGEAIDVNKVSKALRTAGIDLNEYLTGMKGLDDIFLELASKWDSLDQVQQRYIATMAAGSRQQSRFIAMMQDYKRTTELVSAAQNAAGASEEQYQKTLESLESKLNKLKNSWDSFILSITNQTAIKFVVDALRSLLDTINKITDALPGMLSGFAKIGITLSGLKLGNSVFNKLFKQIGAQFRGEGIKAGTGFLSGFKSSLNSKFFSKDINAITEETIRLQKEKNFWQLGGVETEEYLIETEKKLGLTQLELNAINTQGLSISQKSALLNGSEASQKALNLIATKGLDDAETKEAITKAVAEAASHRNLLTLIAETSQRTLNIFGIKAEETATYKLITAKIAEGKITSKLNATQLASLAIMGKYIAIIGALVGIIALIVNNTPEKKLEKLNEKFEEATKKAEEAKNKYQDLITSIDELDNKYKTINNYVKGTEEWKNSVKDVNEQVLSLIDTYKELSENVYLDENGILHVNSKDLERVQKKVKQETIAKADNAYTVEQARNAQSRRVAQNQLSAAENVVKDLGIFDIFEEAKKKIEEGEVVSIQALLNQKDIKINWDDYLTRAERGEVEFDRDVSSIADIQRILDQYGQDIIKDDSTSAATKLNSLVSQYTDPKYQSAVFNYLQKVGTGNYNEREAQAEKLIDFIEKNNITQEQQNVLSRALSGTSAFSDTEILTNLTDNFSIALQNLGLEGIIKNAIETAKQPKNESVIINPETFASTSSFAESITGKITSGEKLSKEEYESLRNSYGATDEDFIRINENEWIVKQEKVDSLKQKVEDAVVQLLQSYINAFLADSTNPDVQERFAEVQKTAGYYASNQTKATDENYFQGAKTSLERTGYYQQLIDAEKKASDAEKSLARASIESANAATKQLGALQKLTDAIKNNEDALKNNDKEAISKIAKEASEAFDLDIDTDFIEKNKQDFINFANGVEGSWDKLSDKIIEYNQDSFNNLSNTMQNVKVEGQSLSDFLQNLPWDTNGQATLDDEQLIKSLATDQEAAQQLEAALKAAGIAMKFEWAEEEIEVPDFDAEAEGASGGKQLAKLKTKKIKTRIPKSVRLTNALGQQSTINAGGSKSSGSGSSKSEEKPKYWDNPYDELYNLLEEQNEALRTREKLEREYDRLLKDRTATAKELQQNSLDEIANLQREIDLQSQLQSGRQRQMANLGNQYYRDSEGNARTFSSWGVQQYASYDQKTGVLKIDWDAIERVNDPDKGGAIEAYVSKLEELSKSFEETQESVEEMRDTIREIRERGMSEYLEFEQRIYDALVDYNQRIIDGYSALSDTIENTNSEILSSLRESIDMERQIRDNTKTEEDIADKEARLAYLQRDTSGANQQEILKLQQELDNARESYGDTLIDQMIERLNKDNELANEQRAKQIEIMQAQLDYAAESGVFWGQVNEVLNNAFDANGNLNNNSALVELLAQSEGFKGMSELGQLNWINDLTNEWKVAQEGLTNWIESSIKELILDENGNVIGIKGITDLQEQIKTIDGDQLSKVESIFDNTSSEVTNSGNIATDTDKISLATQENSGSLFDNILKANTSQNGSLSDMVNNGIILKFNPLNQTWTDEQGNKYNVSYDSQTQKIKSVKMEPTKQVSVGSGNYSSGGSSYSSYNKWDTLAQIEGTDIRRNSQQTTQLQNGLNEAIGSTLEDDGKYGRLTTEQVKALQRELGFTGKDVDGIWGPKTAAAVRKAAGYAYASGGLVDRTGPAWLDGTKSHPEMVLSAKDTENFISLRDILSNLLKNGTTNNTTTGDNYYNIQIDAELTNDYDVDQLAARLKKQIYDDSAYRNVNAISYIR